MKIRRTLRILGIFFILSLVAACVKVDVPDPPSGPGEPGETPPTFVPYQKMEFTAERKILNSHATNFEAMFITDNEYIRVDRNLDIVEKRPLDATQNLYGRPALNDNSFARLTEDGNSRQILEFHLTRNPQEVRKFTIVNLPMLDDSEHVEVDFQGRHFGAFSDNGVYFLLATKTYPNFHYTCFIFELRHTSTFNNFNNIEVIHRVEIPELDAEFANLSAIRFVDGNWYLATKNGGYRIRPDGISEKILSPWIIDYFETNGTLYATGFEAFNFYESVNNGRDWTRVEGGSELNYVETAGDHLFTQDNTGRQYQLADETLQKAQPVIYNTEFPDDPDTYVIADFFNGLYFFSVHKEIYHNTVILTE